MKVADYKELRVYKLAFDSAMEVFDLSRLRDHYDHICRQLTKMIGDAASWCGRGSELREVPAEYVVGTSEPEDPRS